MFGWPSHIDRVLFSALCLCMIPAQANRAFAETPQARSLQVPRANVTPRVIRLPVIDRNDIRFKNLSTAQGLSQTRVSQIVQDDQGFMWFGTQYGLNRFDGYNFKVFVNDPRVPNSLSGVFIEALFKDRQGALWIGCGQFLNRFDPLTESFTRYPVQLVNHISQDSAGLLWLATGKGLYRLDPATGAILSYSHDPEDPRSLSSNDVKSSGEDRKGHLWVATSEGLDEFDRQTGEVTLHIPLREPARIFSFYEDRFGLFWIIHESGTGLAVFDRETNTLTHYSFRDREPPSTATTGVDTLLEDRSGNLWFGTEDEGLLRFDRRQRQFIRYRSNPGDSESIAHDGVSCLYQDREGVIWASVRDYGVTRFETKPAPLQKLPHELGNPNSNAEPFISAIYEDRRGALWVGTREALSRLDLETGQYTRYHPSEPGIEPYVVSIGEDRSDRFWVGTFNHGLLLFDRKTGGYQTFRYSPNDPHSLSNDIVTRLLVDRNGTLWAATWDGLNQFDASTGQFTRYYFDPQKKDLLYLELVEDPHGALWLGTHSSGVQRFDPATNHFTVYEYKANRPGSLSDNRVNSVHFDRSGTMWVGTQNGLNRFDPKTGSFKTWYEQDGLAGDVVSCILEDGRGNLWMGTNNGLSKFDPLRQTFKNYSTAEGLPGADLTGWGACYMSSNGEMFFGGFSGGIAFYPDKVVDDPYVPPIVLTDFRLFDRPVAVGVDSPLNKTIGYTNALSLSHDKNIFSLEFSALSYFNPATNRYRYKLEGLDRQWHEVASNQRLVTYTTLPAGIYTFRVQGATSRGAWSEPGSALSIEILPPWWKRWWFITIYSAMTLLLVWWVHHYRLRQVAQQYNSRLAERIAERTRIARELHDTMLQSFQGVLLKFHTLTYMIRERPAEACEKLEGFLEEGRQAITEGREAIQGLRSSTVIQNDLARALAMVGERLAAEQSAQSPVDFRVVVQGESRNMHPILRDEVYRVASEATGNAFRHSGATRIVVEICYDDRQLRVRVEDNGKGIDPKTLDGGGLEGHYGLPGMRERAKLAGGKLTVRSRLDSGTEIELTIPASLAYAKSSAPSQSIS
jgi:ligand-binding sensor domain-containing protein/signal transduction histidine kinase